jgi:uncharacterized protein involved in response to NO
MWTALRREPFRIFFPLAVAFGTLGIGHWLAFQQGWTTSYSGAFHAHVQVWGYIGSFAIGFLLTALPRSGGHTPASSFELAAALAAVIATVAAVALEQWLLANIINVLLLGLVIAFAARRFAAKRAPSGAAAVRTGPPPPVEFVWIPIALAFGVVGSLIAAAGRAELLSATVIKIGEVASQQGFLLSVVLGVGGFMAPRLMGHGDVMARPACAPASDPARARRRRLRVHLLAAGALVVSFVIEGLGSVRWAYLLRGAVVAGELVFAAKIHRLPRVDSLFARTLWSALWLTALGVIAAGIFPNARVAMLHITFLGGFALMTFAMGAMVVMSHSGDARRLMLPLPAFRFIAAGVAAALLARVTADARFERYFEWLALASVGWGVAAIAWIKLVASRFARVAAADEFERSHEQAKAELLRASAVVGGRTHRP